MRIMRRRVLGDSGLLPSWGNWSFLTSLCCVLDGSVSPFLFQEGTYFNICLIDGKIEASAG